MGERQEPSKSYSFGWLFVKRFAKLQILFFPSWKSKNALLFAALLILKLLEEVVGYKVGLLSGQFYLVLGEKDFDGFITATIKSLTAIGFISAIKTLRMFAQKLLAVGWRESLSLKIHQLYFKEHQFYKTKEQSTGSKGHSYLISSHVSHFR